MLPKMVHDGTHLVIPAIESTSCRLRLLTAFYMFTVYIAFINGLVEGKIYRTFVSARP